MRKSGFTAVLAAGMLLLAACGSEAKNIDAAALASSLVTDISYDDQLEQISDDDMVLLARDISKKIEAEMEYPGQIKVNVIRESRVIDYAK